MTLFQPCLTSPGGRGEPYRLKRPNVFVGSGSEGLLKPGDHLLSINTQSADLLTHVEAQSLFRGCGTAAELEVSRRAAPDMLEGEGMLGGDELLQAKALLTETLVPLLAPGRRGAPMAPMAPMLPRSSPMTGAPMAGPPMAGPPMSGPPMAGPMAGPQDTWAVRTAAASDEVPLAEQPYRTTPLVLPHAKTIHDMVPAARFLAHHAETPGGQPYRNSTVSLPAPRTLNDLTVGRGAPVYQQFRGPQFNTQMAKPAQKAGLPPLSYNSPAPLYSEESRAEAAAAHPGLLQGTQGAVHRFQAPGPRPQLPTAGSATVSKPHESETFRMILESEMGAVSNHAGVGGRHFERQLSGQERPGSQQSDRSSETGRPALDPVMKNTSINQSASFKKVMYSVMGETEF